jgi:hypothetical protein
MNIADGNGPLRYDPPPSAWVFLRRAAAQQSPFVLPR